MMKGQEWIGGLFSLLLAGVVAGIALPMILPGQAVKVTAEVDSNEFENKALIIANSVMSDERLIYFDVYSNSFQRGVFDKDKLDFMSGRNLDIGYPDAYVSITITDISGTPEWSFDAGSVLENTRSTQILNSVRPIGRGFPVAIRYSESQTDMGVLTVTVTE